jgi:hypothetical protein
VAKGERRDWAQLEAFEAEYVERLEDERKQRRNGGSQYLDFLDGLARGREHFYRDEIKSRDDRTRRLFALRNKIVALREKLGLADEDALIDAERPFATTPPPRPAPAAPDDAAAAARVRFLADPVPAGHRFPVTFDEIRATLAELPPEHAATVREVRLSNQKRTGTDGDWLEGEIRLHCLLAEDGRRPIGRTEGTSDVERFGGTLEWEGAKLYARWPLDAYKTFVLRRVLIHEVAHGVAELPGYADRVRRAGSVERFCEQYAENFYRPPGKSRKLPF